MRDVEQTATASAASVDLVDGRVPNRILLMPLGELKPNDGRKPWLIDGPEHAAEIIAATQANLGNRHFMIDYDHQAARAQQVAGKAEAAGWIDPATLTVTDQGISGEVEWTQTARALLKDRAYRYLSPFFSHLKNGRVTRLFNISLTNTPALDMGAIASSQPGEELDMKPIIAALGLAENADETAIVAAIDQLKAGTSLAAIASALQLEENASADEITAAASAAVARPEIDLAPIAVALGAAEDATPEQLAAAAAELKATASGKIDPLKFVPVETYNLAIARSAQADEERATASVDAAIASGKVAPANRDWALSCVRQDEAGFAAMVANSPSIITPGENDLSSTAATEGQLTEEEQAVCSALGIAPDAFLKTKKDLA